MRIPAFHNFPFAAAAKVYQFGSRMVHSRLHLIATYLLATRYEANHYGERLERFEGRAPGQRFGGLHTGKTFWGKLIPANKSMLWGLATSALILEMRSGSGALPINGSLMKYSLAQGGFMVLDGVMATRFLFKPMRPNGSANYKLHWVTHEQGYSKKEIMIGLAYFGLRVADMTIGQIGEIFHNTPNRIPVFPLLFKIGRFGVTATWKVGSTLIGRPIRLASRLIGVPAA